MFILPNFFENYKFCLIFSASFLPTISAISFVEACSIFLIDPNFRISLARVFVPTPEISSSLFLV